MIWLWSIRNTDASDVTRYLIDRGAGMEVKDINGQTPLHFAVANGICMSCHFQTWTIIWCRSIFHTDKEDAAKILIEKGANIHARDKSEATPLAIAILKGNLSNWGMNIFKLVYRTKFFWISSPDKMNYLDEWEHIEPKNVILPVRLHILPIFFCLCRWKYSNDTGRSWKKTSNERKVTYFQVNVL